VRIAKWCSYCRVVQFIAFWGPLREAKWKRPALLICSFLLGGGSAFVTWMLYGQEEYKFFPLLFVPLSALGFLGVLVAFNGCDACVARLFGNA
jgi:hypothetical protein